MRDSQRLDLLFFLSLKVRILKVRVLEWGGSVVGWTLPWKKVLIRRMLVKNLPLNP